MQGRPQFQPKLFHTLNLDEFVPDNHLLRKIDKVLQLEFVHELTSSFYCADNGRTSIDPILFSACKLLVIFLA